MLIKKGMILLLHNENGAFMPSVYLDSHGEVDPGLRFFWFNYRRGNPLFLNMARFDALRLLWLEGKVAAWVGRKIEASFDFGGWRTL